jgi:hypothetical protein
MRWLGCLLVLALGGAVGGSTVSLAEVRRLLDARVPDDVVIAKLSASTCSFQLTADEVVDFTKRGVSQEVLRAMITCGMPAHDVGANPCAADVSPSPVAFPDLEWDHPGLRADFVTLFVSTAGLCLKRAEDQIRRPILWENVVAICEEPGYQRHVYLKLKTPIRVLSPVHGDRVLIFKGKPATLHPLFAYIRKLRPELTVDCTLMEE